jgi:hypothetical protein
MRAYHLAGLVALLYWQIAPIPPREAPPRRGLLRVGLALAAGDWDHDEFGCNGELLSSEVIPVRSAGVKLDYRPAGAPLRVSAAVGRWWADNMDSFNPYPPSASIARVFAGAQIALETRAIGIGAGILSNPAGDPSDALEPSIYLRWGREAPLHFRADVYPISETPGASGVARFGVGFGEGVAGRISGFVGLSFGPFGSHKPQVQADLGIPISPHVELLTRGNLGPSETGWAQWAAGGGMRLVW